MGLLDDLAGAATGTGSQGEGEANPLMNGVLELVSNHPGGIGGLANQFQQSGLGDVISSWIGTGQNQPISADQLQGVLGNDTVNQFASKFGLSQGVAGSQLAQLLPLLIDQLTPRGQVPQGNLMSIGMGLLKGFLSK
jgi:uncharacterized protein YidB (DUF937 family)